MDAHNLSCLLLCSNYKNSKQLEIDELHINFWDFDNEYIIMDIGLLINIPEEFKNNKNLDIAIHIPGRFKKNNIIDLGNLLSSDIDVVSAIFNDNIDLFQKTNQLAYFKRYESSKRDKCNKCKNIILLPLDKDIFEIKINDDSNSSSIMIKLSTYLNDEENFIHETMGENSEENSYVYIRFRLVDVKRTKFISDFNQKDSAILSSSTKSKIFDFRVNENRWIPKKWQRNLLTIKKMHCFLIIHREYELNHNSTNFVGSRSLIEEPIWNKYLGFGNESNNKLIENTQLNMGYHWKIAIKDNEDTTQNFLILGRFSMLKSSKSKVIKFLLFLLITSLLSNAIYNIIYLAISNSLDKLYSLNSFGNNLWIAIGSSIILVIILFIDSWMNFTKKHIKPFITRISGELASFWNKLRKTNDKQ